MNIVLNTPNLENRNPPKIFPNKQQVAKVEPTIPIAAVLIFIAEK